MKMQWALEDILKAKVLHHGTLVPLSTFLQHCAPMVLADINYRCAVPCSACGALAMAEDGMLHTLFHQDAPYKQAPTIGGPLLCADVWSQHAAVCGNQAQS
jgi:hypothetical protein